MATSEQIQPVLQKFLDLREPPVPLNKATLEPFLTSVINGDEVVDSIVFPATLREGRKGVLGYILTTTKVIKIEIDEKESKSSPVYLRDVLAVTRTFPGPTGSDRAKVLVEVAQGSFGLSYPVNNQTIDQFFRRVDEEVRKVKTPKVA